MRERERLEKSAEQGSRKRVEKAHGGIVMAVLSGGSVHGSHSEGGTPINPVLLGPIYENATRSLRA